MRDQNFVHTQVCCWVCPTLIVGVERVSLWLEAVRPREAQSMFQAPLTLTLSRIL